MVAYIGNSSNLGTKAVGAGALELDRELSRSQCLLWTQVQILSTYIKSWAWLDVLLFLVLWCGWHQRI